MGRMSFDTDVELGKTMSCSCDCHMMIGATNTPDHCSSCETDTLLPKNDEELREQLEDISCEYGRPHEDNCDLNQENGAVNGCTCSVSKLMDEITTFISARDTKMLEQARLDELKKIPHRLLHIPEVYQYKQDRITELTHD